MCRCRICIDWGIYRVGLLGGGLETYASWRRTGILGPGMHIRGHWVSMGGILLYCCNIRTHLQRRLMSYGNYQSANPFTELGAPCVELFTDLPSLRDSLLRSYWAISQSMKVFMDLAEALAASTLPTTRCSWAPRVQVAGQGGDEIAQTGRC